MSLYNKQKNDKVFNVNQLLFVLVLTVVSLGEIFDCPTTRLVSVSSRMNSNYFRTKYDQSLSLKNLTFYKEKLLPGEKVISLCCSFIYFILFFFENQCKYLTP